MIRRTVEFQRLARPFCRRTPAEGFQRRVQAIN